MSRQSRALRVLESVGVVGIAISVIAYLPQIAHIGREHCAAGISRRAWAMWLVSSMLVGVVAISRRDPVFILLQASTLASAAAILLLARRYRGRVCEFHAQHYRAALASNARENDDQHTDADESAGPATTDATAP
jgi:lipid-A-disaccharide synthase-like uncharacterized protein